MRDISIPTAAESSDKKGVDPPESVDFVETGPPGYGEVNGKV